MIDTKDLLVYHFWCLCYKICWYITFGVYVIRVSGCNDETKSGQRTLYNNGYLQFTYNMVSNLLEKRRLLARKVEIAKQKERLLLDTLHKTFKRSENKLTTNLISDGADVQVRGRISLIIGFYMKC